MIILVFTLVNHVWWLYHHDHHNLHSRYLRESSASFNLDRNCEEVTNLSTTKSAKNIFDISSKVLSQICSTLFDYPAIRECEELVRVFIQNPNCFFFCHLFSYHRCGTLEIAWIQRGASRHSAPSTWSSKFHPQHKWSSTIWSSEIIHGCLSLSWLWSQSQSSSWPPSWSSWPIANVSTRYEERQFQSEMHVRFHSSVETSTAVRYTDDPKSENFQSRLFHAGS